MQTRKSGGGGSGKQQNGPIQEESPRLTGNNQNSNKKKPKIEETKGVTLEDIKDIILMKEITQIQIDFIEQRYREQDYQWDTEVLELDEYVVAVDIEGDNSQSQAQIEQMIRDKD